MIIDQLIRHSWSSVPIIFLGFVLVRLLVNKFCQGLNRIPGPWLAGYTDLWRVFVVWGRRPELMHIKLHEKYGKVVRLGPRAVSISDPDAVKIIYGLNAGFVKSDFYPVQQTIARGSPLHSLFNTTDEQFHAKLRRSVSNAYAMSTLVNFEAFVDSTSTEFIKQLKQRYADQPGASGICDLGTWLQYYAFDVIGELTYSKRIGFVENGVDVDQIIGNLEWLLNYVAVVSFRIFLNNILLSPNWIFEVGQLPFLDRVLIKNPIRMWMSKLDLLNFNSPVVEFAKRRMVDSARLEEGKSGDQAPSESGVKRKDFLTRFKEAGIKDPAFISQERVLALTVANMFAGSDTTAISLRAVFYFLLKNPSSMQKLTEELSYQSKTGKFTRDDGLVRWEEARGLPYLTAVINESLRCHPAVGLTLERIVPKQGVTVAGHTLPGGTIAGCSAWVLHRDETVWGSHPEEFRPERWVDASPEQQKAMGNALFSFGSGARTCIGKNISLLEMYKLVPALIRTFQIELADPNSSWELHNAWFVKQSNLRVYVKSRDNIL